jgi:hypothetical protein
MSVVAPSAPSAVWTTLTPSWELRTAKLMPRILLRRPSEIVSPEASSAAELIRYPDDNRANDLSVALSVRARVRCPPSAATLVAILIPILSSVGSGVSYLLRRIRAAKFCTQDNGWKLRSCTRTGNFPGSLPGFVGEQLSQRIHGAPEGILSARCVEREP